MASSSRAVRSRVLAPLRREHWFLVPFLFLFASAAVADCLVPQWEVKGSSAFGGEARDTLAMAHFDADGKLDVVTIGRIVGTVSVIDDVVLLRGNGDATFGEPFTVYEAAELNEVVARDLNGDTTLDLLIDGAKALVFLPGRGDGTFGPPVLSPTPEGYHFATAELTGDGIVDVALVAYDESGPESLIVLEGNGHGSFAERRRQLLADNAYGIAAGDLDADGTSDLVVSYFESSPIDILYGNGDGTFDPTVSRQSGTYALTPTIADAEGDGDLDILGTNWNEDTVSVHRNHGGRTFDPVAVYALDIEPIDINNNPSSTTVADVNGDGLLDLVVSAVNGQFMATLRGNGDGTFGPPAYKPAYSFPGPVLASDLDGDGRADLITADRAAGRVVVLKNRCGDLGELRFTPLTPSIPFGQDARFQVNVVGYNTFGSAPVSTGNVSIVEGDTVLATATLSSGVAFLTIEGLAPGAHALRVRYSGDAQYEPAQSDAVVQRVTTPRQRSSRH